ncbi:MAG: phasin family protein [Pseudomonadota bacterium]
MAMTEAPTTRPQIYDVQPFFEASRASFAAMADAQQRIMRRAMALGEEMMRFTEKRLTHDRETLSALAHCRTPKDAIALYGQFLDRAGKDYSEEAGKFAGLCADQTRELLTDTRDEVGAVLAPVLSPGGAVRN